MKKLRICALAFLAGLTCSKAAAEPGPTVRALMNEPVSAFSFGLFRLDEYAIRQLKKHSDLSTTMVLYDWDRNRIGLHFFLIKEVGDLQFEAICKRVISEIRENALLLKKNGFAKSSLIAEMFTPIGYQDQKHIKIRDEVDKIVHIIISAGGQMCEGGLLGDGYSIRKK